MDIEVAAEEWERSPAVFSATTVHFSHRFMKRDPERALDEIVGRYATVLADADMTAIDFDEFRQFCLFARGMWPRDRPSLRDVLARTDKLIAEYASFVELGPGGEPDDDSNPSAASDRDWLIALGDRLSGLSAAQFMRLAEAILDHRVAGADGRGYQPGYERLQHRTSFSRCTSS